MLLQFLPKAPERARVADLDPGDAPEGTVPHVVPEDDAWVEGRSLIATVEDVELIDPALSSERLVYRLFHERGVRVFRSLDGRGAMLVLARRRRGDAAELLAGRPRPHGGERRDLGDLRVLQRELPVRARGGRAEPATSRREQGRRHERGCRAATPRSSRRWPWRRSLSADPARAQTCPAPLADARRLVLVTAATMNATAATMRLYERASPARSLARARRAPSPR